MGVNGAGKSTLIKMLSGVEQPTKGEVEIGHKVDVEYFAQDQYKEMDPEAIMFAEIGRMAPRMGDAAIRTLLGCFLFSGDDVFKQVGVLSGGERNRFALARMLLQPKNFLLLDEPTNHLDLRAKDVLLRAMLDFTGTIVFVSHDRYFIDRLSTKIFAISGDGGIDIYPGNYEDYLWSLERRKEGEIDGKAPGGPSSELVAALSQARGDAGASSKPQNGSAVNGAGAAAVERKRMNPIQANKLRDRVRELEAEVSTLEDESAKFQAELATTNDYERQTELLSEMENRRTRIEKNEAEWEELTEKLEAEA